MNTTPIPNWSFFSIIAWYAVFAPFVAAGIIGIGLVIGIPDRHSDSSADYYFGTAACVLLSSATASIVSLFGIRWHGWRVVVWKSAVGFVLSCLVYLALIYISMLKTSHQ
ncbi:MAG: hypothetical protein ACLQSR_07985 [Limisphaerales bacterium]